VAELERRLVGAQAGGGAGAGQPSGGGDGGGGVGSDSADPQVEVVELLRAGKEVQATALVHKQKGSSLVEAKAEVDRLKAQLSL
jgi:hypothetical protein